MKFYYITTRAVFSTTDRWTHHPGCIFYYGPVDENWIFEQEFLWCFLIITLFQNVITVLPFHRKIDICQKMAIMNNYLVQNSLLKFHLQAVLQIPTTEGMAGSGKYCTRGDKIRNHSWLRHSWFWISSPLGQYFLLPTAFGGWYSYTPAIYIY